MNLELDLGEVYCIVPRHCDIVFAVTQSKFVNTDA